MTTQDRKRTNRQAALFWTLSLLFAGVGGLSTLADEGHDDPAPEPTPVVEQPLELPTPAPGPILTEWPSPAVDDCGDGTRGTFGECWQQMQEDIRESLGATAHAGTLCRDGWISRSVGSGTCSHHGGVAP